MTKPDIAIWEADVRSWLEATVGYVDDVGHTPDLEVFRDLTDDRETVVLQYVRSYRRARFDAGYGALTLPAEYGGAGLPASFAARFSQIERGYAVPPSTELISVTTGLVAPAVALYGSQAQRDRYLRALLRTDLLACQLFSELGAGSDLAGLTCRAESDGAGWTVHGQKVWTSGARHADLGLLLARTDPTVGKHHGITAFLVPLDSPGIAIRPIRQMSGASSFNEVFLDAVTIPDELRIGEVGQGWEVAKATLAFERQASGSGTRQKGGTFEDLLAVARRRGRLSDPVVRQNLIDVYVLAELRTATSQRVTQAAAAGESPGPAGSVGKLVASELLVAIGEYALELLGTDAIADHGNGDFAWTAHLLGAPGYRLAGGTDQIQRNIIAERVLGLPPEPRPDVGRSFSELARG
ncbi:acyl-CoA dehydrogenase family protein [Mycobacterium sp. AZCC_0083]|uniref:acyl-CoA dehydrogenase family protein n=1 Tax=Mycobacterium sp. AZCC_0083 TaxID=2735882 RepID=UPI001615201E|nr:acyl-CoA dehydrogenase family protein [Mycobacterium sp. AZCC_0083]MBB5164009.1 alkylation response protein AidB-like acyl-CoA dehydrogenase [Mycobacterium sp. AZCC_0083]